MNKKTLSDRAGAYAIATGKCPSHRAVKAQIYGAGKPRIADGERTASASALPERIAEGACEKGLVPNFAYVTDASDSPINNMGENLNSADGLEVAEMWTAITEEDLGEVELVLSDSGKVKTVMVRRPSTAQACIIDWINFTVLEDTFFKTARQVLVTDDQIIEEASRQFEKIFGFGITEKRDRGLNFYRESWVLGDQMGFVCFGGQRSTMQVTLTGQGCANAIQGWERRLYDWLTKVAVRPSISRLDLAHDDLEGEYLSVDWADAQWSSGGFTFKQGGRPPEIQHLGNWKRPSGKGRTLTIGTRASSKFCRFYEKGRKEGDRESLWCRCEVEFKNSNTVIPPEALLNPTEYFVGAYPCLSEFAHVETPARMEVKSRAAHINVDASIAITLRQYGRYIRTFRELYGDKATLDKICFDGDDYMPKRLKILTNGLTTGTPAVHAERPIRVPSFIEFVTTVPCFGLNGENGFSRPRQ